MTLELEEAKKIIFVQKPVFAQIYEGYKNRTWLDYARENFPNTNNSTSGGSVVKDSSRFKELSSALEKILTPLFGSIKTTQTIKALLQNPFVSSCDHHGVLCHPFFLNATLLRSHSDLTGANHAINHITNSKIIISFTCGGVSLSNSSYPRGIFFHDQNLLEVRIPFITLHGRHRPVYGHTAFTKDKLVEIKEKINSFMIPHQAKIKLQDFFDTLLLRNEIWHVQNFSDQLTIINSLLWKAIFQNTRPSLVYVESESIIRQLLLDVHLRKKTLIHHILFNPQWQAAYINNFDGVTGAHIGRTKGTHFFWYIDQKNNTREQLWLKKNRDDSYALVTPDKRVVISCNPETIRKHLEKFELLPSMALTYCMLSFYYGIKLGGGFSQVQYLGDMKKAWSRLLNDCGGDTKHDVGAANGASAVDDATVEKSQRFEHIRTDIFTGEYVAIGLHNPSRTAPPSVPATLIDILLWSEKDAGSIIDEQFEKITITETLDLMMPEFIHIITKSRQKIESIPQAPHTFYV